MRVNITLEHKASGERLYLTSKNKRNTPDRLHGIFPIPKATPTFGIRIGNKSLRQVGTHLFERVAVADFQPGCEPYHAATGHASHDTALRRKASLPSECRAGNRARYPSITPALLRK